MDKIDSSTIQTLIGFVTNLVYLAVLGFGGKFAFAHIQNYWVEAKPNEWMLILRRGELVQCAVGLCTWIWPGD